LEGLSRNKEAPREKPLKEKEIKKRTKGEEEED